MGDSSDDDNDDDDDDTDDECLFKFGENSGYNSGKARTKQSDREIEKNKFLEENHAMPPISNVSAYAHRPISNSPKLNYSSVLSEFF